MKSSNNTPINSFIVVSNDSTSKKIRMNKNTNLPEFYSAILSNFPNLDDMKLFYFEGYMKEKFFVSNEEEYIIANKKGIEYFYICGKKNESELIDYLKYYSVILFSPVKTLNKEYQINDRKKMQMEQLETINEVNDDNENLGYTYNINKNLNNNINNNLNNNNANYNQINNFNNYNVNMNINPKNINNNYFQQGNPCYNNNPNMNNYMNNPNFNNNNINYMNMSMNNQNMQNYLFNFDQLNKELFDAFMNDKNKYNYMISTLNPSILDSCCKRMAEMNKNYQLLI